MSEYDNTDKGAAFKPFDGQAMILQGSVNSRGTDSRVVLVKNTTKNGKQIIEVYSKAGVLFNNESENENAPHYTGVIETRPGDERRLAAWKRAKDGNPYMTLAVSDKKEKEDQNKELIDDDIPF